MIRIAMLLIALCCCSGCICYYGAITSRGIRVGPTTIVCEDCTNGLRTVTYDTVGIVINWSR